MKHQKRIHNGKNRVTGRKISQRSEIKETTKTRTIGKPNTFCMPILRRPTQQHCNCSSSERILVNERLFAELMLVPQRQWPMDWDELTGTWVCNRLPSSFVRKHRKHMRHFREYARNRIGL